MTIFVGANMTIGGIIKNATCAKSADISQMATSPTTIAKKSEGEGVKEPKQVKLCDSRWACTTPSQCASVGKGKMGCHDSC